MDTRLIIYIALSIILLYGLIVLIYYLLQERLLFIGDPLKRKFRFTLSSPFEEIFLDTPDGGLIHALHVKSQKPKGLILYFHGNTGNLKRWSLVAQELTTYDMDVIVVDYRGFGKSSGRRSEQTLHEDAQLIFDYARELYSQNQIFVYGRSLGSGLAVRLASQNTQAGLILETPYLSLLDVVKHHFSFLPVKLILRYPIRSDRWIEKVACPVIIFHGSRDKIVPFNSGLKLYGLISQDAKNSMVTLTKGKHNNLNQFALFREKMHEFIDRYAG